MVDARQSAVLVGAGQLTQREAEAKRAMSPRPTPCSSAAVAPPREASWWGAWKTDGAFSPTPPQSPVLLSPLAAAEAIGLQGVVSHSGGVNVFDPD